MEKKVYRGIGVALIILGILVVNLKSFLIITGAVVGVSSVVFRVSFWIGLVFIIGGFILVIVRMKGLGKVVNEAEALLKQGKILTKSNDLIRLGRRMGYDIISGGRHMKAYKEDEFITPIPTHPTINRNTARGIMIRFRDNYES